MNMLMLLVFVAVIATVISLIGGILSMTVGHDIGHRTSAQWMKLRVACQGAALLLIVLAVFGAH